MIQNVPIHQLKPSDRQDIHAPWDRYGRDAWLVVSVAAHGILTPLLVAPDGTIIDGWRRWNAAKATGLTEVPCVSYDGNFDTAFESSQLGRNLTVYAKVLLYRVQIESLIEAARHNSLVALQGKKPASVEEQWECLESILGVKRRTLTRGATLLAELEQQEKSKNVKTRDRAHKLRHVFRTAGLHPALRMIGEEDSENEDAEPAPDAPKHKTTPRPTVHWAERHSRSILRLNADLVKYGVLPKPIERKLQDVLSYLRSIQNPPQDKAA